MYETKMAGNKTAKLNCTLTSTTTTKTNTKRYGYKAVRRQDFSHMNTGLRKKVYKREG